MSMTSSQRNEVMRNVQQQVQMAQLQEIISRTSHSCFEKCIGKPGTSLDNSEKTCLSKCMDRYMETVNFVTRVYASRLQREMAGAGHHQ
eukprot:m.18077 g.18077  ORF g.18077 m.18077 type:complete len:89 (+) comp7291_c0_seq2:1128-1394(+)